MELEHIDARGHSGAEFDNVRPWIQAQKRQCSYMILALALVVLLLLNC
jgi:hypothetical protein